MRDIKDKQTYSTTNGRQVKLWSEDVFYIPGLDFGGVTGDSPIVVEEIIGNDETFSGFLTYPNTVKKA